MKVLCYAIFAAILTACSAPAMDVSPTTTRATITSTAAATSVPTQIPTTAQANIDTPVPPTATPSSATSSAQVCQQMVGKAQRGLYVIELQPIPSLIWDQVPREFRVGICNTLTVSTVPDGEFTLFVFLPEDEPALGQTSSLTAQLTPGFHRLTLKSWTPGFENHVTACATRPEVEIQVDYADSPRAQNFRPLTWLNGKDRVVFPVKCAGDFP